MTRAERQLRKRRRRDQRKKIRRMIDQLGGNWLAKSHVERAFRKVVERQDESNKHIKEGTQT